LNEIIRLTEQSEGMNKIHEMGMVYVKLIDTQQIDQFTDHHHRGHRCSDRAGSNGGQGEHQFPEARRRWIVNIRNASIFILFVTLLWI
jgi:hypothetical protein